MQKDQGQQPKWNGDDCMENINGKMSSEEEDFDANWLSLSLSPSNSSRRRSSTTPPSSSPSLPVLLQQPQQQQQLSSSPSYQQQLHLQLPSPDPSLACFFNHISAISYAASSSSSPAMIGTDLSTLPYAVSSSSNSSPAMVGTDLSTLPYAASSACSSAITTGAPIFHYPAAFGNGGGQSPSASSPRPCGGRTRRNHTQAPKGGKSESIPPPYPWATDRRAKVHSLSYLLSQGIKEIHGEVQCKRCEYLATVRYDLLDKFKEVSLIFMNNRHLMHDRAPDEWQNPTLPDCECRQTGGVIRPVIDGKKRNINWLFLLLGQKLGCCTLDQLKYFCKHTKNHRTGAKDRVLYLTYITLFKQLDPTGPW